MQAWIADGVGGCVLREVEDPPLEAGGVVVAVDSISVNRGEVTRLAHAEAGWRPGWDFAGTVIDADADTLPVGTRVAGLALGGGWAERVAVPAGSVAPVPQDVQTAVAAALPTAGVTALRMLRLSPGTLGRRVLVSGAAGGVGRYAVQLARLGGGEVTALVGREARAVGLRELGASDVRWDIDQLDGPFDLVLESVGGPVLAKLASLVASDGTLVIFGNSSDQATTFGDIRDVYLGGARRLQSFTLYHDMRTRPLRPDLASLLRFVERGTLDPQVGLRLDWTDLPDAIRMLDHREINGKAVLRVGNDPG